jgi:hypothetical protein
MRVEYSSSVGDFRPDNGLERKNNYVVKNISPENINDNNLIEFWIPGGLNQGILYATEDTGDWQVDIFENRTKFTGDGEYIPSGQENTFYTYVSESQPMGPGMAGALARGDGYGQLDFNVVETTVAISKTTTNNVPIRWLEGYGYSNDFDSASLLDPDGDSFLNWEEYHADTDPTNASSYLLVLMSPSNLVIQSSDQCDYALEGSNNLSSNEWNVCTNLSGTGSDLIVETPNAEPQRYYRLKAWRKAE